MANLSAPAHLTGHLSSPKSLHARIERGASQATIDALTEAVKENLAEENLLATEADREFWDLGRLTCYVNPENPKNLVFELREKE